MEKLWVLFLIYFCVYFLNFDHLVKGCHIYTSDVNKSYRAKCVNQNPKNIYNKTLLAGLEYMSIQNKLINILDGDLFTNTPNIKSLDLSNNGLAKIVPNTFLNLPRLQSLTLSMNSLSLNSNSFNPNDQPGLKQLVYLDLSYNQIHYVPDRVFSQLGNTLKVLKLSNRAIGGQMVIEPRAFEGLRNLEELNLSHSRLEGLSEDLEPSFKKMSLKRLDLNTNDWRCDCRLKWLKQFIDSRKHVLEPFASYNYKDPNIFDSMKNLTQLYPICQSPEKVANKFLIGPSKYVSDKVIKLSEMTCPLEIFTVGITYTLAEKSNITLVCEFFSDPIVTVRWFKNENEEVNDQWPNIKKTQTNQNAYTANLTIFSFSHLDQGIWKCQASDGKISRSTNYTLELAPSQNWIYSLNTFALKYTGLASACLLLFIIFIGLIIYCCYAFRSGNKVSRKPVNYSNIKTVSNNNNLMVGFESANLKLGPHGNHFIDGHNHEVNSNILEEDNFAPYNQLAAKMITNYVQVCSITNTSKMILTPSTAGLEQTTLEPGSKLEDYVTFRVISPTDPEIQENLHNFSIQPLTVLSPFGNLDNSRSNTEFEEKYFSSPSHSTFIPAGLVTSQSKSAFLEPIIAPSMEFNLKNPVSIASEIEMRRNDNAAYSPCPLHGNLLATSTMSHGRYQSSDPLRDESIKSELSTFCASLGRNSSFNNTVANENNYSPGLHDSFTTENPNNHFILKDVGTIKIKPIEDEGYNTAV